MIKNMKEKRKHQKSIFSRLVKSYILFLIGSLIIFFIMIFFVLALVSKGSINNLSPQSVVNNDGTLNDIDTLSSIGGWVEELDSEGNVINVVGDRKIEKESYSFEELSDILDLGYVKYNGNGIDVTEAKTEEVNKYSAIVRYAGSPKRIFLVCYPGNRISIRATYMISGETNNNALIFIAVMVALFLLEVLLISNYLKRHIDKPLKLLMQGMDEVSEGKRDVVLDYKTDKEFEDIRDRFNLMAEKLKESESEKHRLQQNRNQMLLELAHDIKNPVASIKSSIGALEEGLVAEDKKNDYYKRIDMKAERIRTLIEDMNTSLKMESDDYKLKIEKADVCEIVRRICVEFYEDITETGKDFDIDIPDESLYSEVDVQLFGRVINNLLANANKYNSTGKSISVKVSKDAGQILVEVADDGVAIDEDFVPRMFEAFSRGDSTRKTDGGTGLGLAISHKIVEKHKGTLKYVRAEDKNCFCVRINELQPKQD